jgi:hypothetical protein
MIIIAGKVGLLLTRNEGSKAGITGFLNYLYHHQNSDPAICLAAPL